MRASRRATQDVRRGLERGDAVHLLGAIDQLTHIVVGLYPAEWGTGGSCIECRRITPGFDVASLRSAATRGEFVHRSSRRGREADAIAVERQCGYRSDAIRRTR